MSSSHKHTETRKSEETKTHPSGEQAMKDFDMHAIEGAAVDPVPLPDQGGHSHSHAAHLSGTDSKYTSDKENAETKAEGNLRQGAYPSGRREPPQEIGRTGKQHRGQ